MGAQRWLARFSAGHDRGELGSVRAIAGDPSIGCPPQRPGANPLPIALLACRTGSLLGCLIWYVIGRLVNEQRLERYARRHGRFVGLSPERLRASRHWFQRHGWKVVCWGRLLPVIRTNVSLTAGIELMPLAAFLGWSALGSSLWNTALILMGYGLSASRCRS